MDGATEGGAPVAMSGGDVAGPGNRIDARPGGGLDDDAGNRLDVDDESYDDDVDDDVDEDDDDDDDDDGFGGDAGNRVEGGTARSVLTYIARSLATEPDAVVIEADDSGRQLRFRIHVAPDDMGRMIGRRGRVAQAIRTLVRVAGSRDGVDTNVDFVDS
jgi:uncharacterized protein